MVGVQELFLEDENILELEAMVWRLYKLVNLLKTELYPLRG